MNYTIVAEPGESFQNQIDQIDGDCKDSHTYFTTTMRQLSNPPNIQHFFFLLENLYFINFFLLILFYFFLF